MHIPCKGACPPLAAYASLRGLPRPFILETQDKARPHAGHTYLGADPSFVVSVDGSGTYLDGRKVSGTTDPCAALAALGMPSAEGELLRGGYVGYLAYGATTGHATEPSVFGYYGEIADYHHADGTCTVHTLHDGPSLLMEHLAPGANAPEALPEPDGSVKGTDADADTFTGMVREAQEYIRAGDAFQVVLSRECSIKTSLSPFEAYLRLRAASPSPYLFLLEGKERSLAGASPETMASVRGNVMHVNPIAGTCGRGKTDQEDDDLARRLLETDKERAEHVMLVDLGRNDVGKVCDPATIALPTLMTVRKYSHVQHIESEVTGRLRAGMTPFDAMAAAFPAGTLTGAPKLRAMEILATLEQTPRRVYGGCAGYFSATGDTDAAIAIRMAEFGSGCTVRAGAGIVADSNPYAEFAETERKMAGVLSALGVAP
ncbi:MAG: chorismate-binding protein [Candidatus Methanofastidiosa archaeon]|nr:chorismate-binding protein [Candidatus Methanofastidiosa archaeon]